nr:DUF2071 domain-containing protein [Planococcus salinus]
MTQEWHDLVFMHWPVDRNEMRKYVPAELEIDIYDGKAWLGLVFFKAKKTRPRFLPPVPGVSSFLELNVRTYVTYKRQSGVYFFSLDADHPLAVKAARLGDFLPYRHAQMAMSTTGKRCTFKSRRTNKGSFPESLELSYRVTSHPVDKTELESWLTERYCLWTKPKGQLLRLDIEHSPWKLQYIQGEIENNTMASFLSKNLHLEKPLTHYSKRKKVRFFPPVPEK